jgi:allantoicase
MSSIMNKMESPAFTSMTDLAAERLGGKVLLCSDDFFAEKENLIKPGRGIFIPDKYTDRGKWMDGWESRRKRTAGNDWCIIQLATSGKCFGVDIDTNHFLGNHPPFASMEALNVMTQPVTNLENANWTEILPISPLHPGSNNFFEISDHNVYTHLRLHIYPDGGVARLKVYGEVFRDWDTVDASETINLAAAANGAKAIFCNDMFFSHMDNLLLPGKGINMGDGWETKRNRSPGNRDWMIIRLAHRGVIEKILVDTAHFKGNYPDSCMIEGYDKPPKEDEGNLTTADINWVPVLKQTKLSADHEHFYEDEIENKGPFTHARFTIYPDGGVSRLRLWGRVR